MLTRNDNSPSACDTFIINGNGAKGAEKLSVD